MNGSAPWSDTAGILACLSAATLWAVAVTIFRRAIETHGARSVNLVKCLLAMVLQGLTVWIVGQMPLVLQASPRSLFYLAASGVVGLFLGDTALFGSVARIGVHRTLLLQTLAPVFTAVIAAIWLGERPSLGQAAGALLILGGVAAVVAPGRRPVGSAVSWGFAGMSLGAIAALGQAGGIVLAKQGMHDIPFLAASFVRLAAAVVGLVAAAALGGRLIQVRRLSRSRDMARVVPATLLGTYLALFLMMAGVALAPAAVAAVLLSTSPVVSLFIDARLEKRRVRPQALAGTLLAVLGVAVLSMG